MKTFLFLLSIILIISNVSFSQDTFSITAIDPVTGQVGSAGASCVNDVTILTDVHPGVGVIHTQASWNSTNQTYAKNLMNAGLPPQQILDSLIAHDAQNNPNIRQYGIIDISGGIIRKAAYTGANCTNYKNHIVGPNYTIQGNILLGQQILDSMEARFNRTVGTLADKLMAALQGAKVIGADTRCAPRGTSSQSSFIRVARTTDPVNNLYLSLKVLNAPVNRDPIDSLQVLYNNWLLTNVYNYSTVIPDNIKLFQNYPNPFNPSTRLKFSLDKDYFVSLKIYNIKGEEIAILVSSNLNAGTYEMQWEPAGLASGVYYYRLEADGFTDTKRMVFIR